MAVIGVDFGTTNSVVTVLAEDGSVSTVRHRFGTAELDVIRSVLCFWNDGARDRVVLRHAAGPAAIEAYLDDPLDSRLMMSLKSYLAQRQLHRDAGVRAEVHPGGADRVVPGRDLAGAGCGGAKRGHDGGRPAGAFRRRHAG